MSGPSDTVVAAWAERPVDRVTSYLASGNGFLGALLLASIVPFVAPLVAIPLAATGEADAYALAAAGVVAAIANAHVFSTFYLLWDRTQLRGVNRPILNLVLVPVAICAVILGLTAASPPTVTAMTLIVVTFYGSYHFGRQNLGVHAFACRIAKGRSMDLVERRTITAGVVLGVIRAGGVGLPTLVRLGGLDEALVQKPCAALSMMGWVGYVVLSGIVIQHVVRNLPQYEWRSLATYLIGVYFFLPGAVSVLLAGSLIIAHGLQYLVFLAYHGVGAARLRLQSESPGGSTTGVSGPALFAILSPFVALALWTLLGQVLFHIADAPKTSLWGEAFIREHTLLLSYLTAVLTSVTVSHYWVDQHLWRFGSPERREWFSQYYAFLRRT
jgi:hypothetical protein